MKNSKQQIDKIVETSMKSVSEEIETMIFKSFMTGESKSMHFVFNLNFMNVEWYDSEVNKSDELVNLFVVNVYYDYLKKLDNDNSKLYTSLSELEQKSYLLHQINKLENGDFLYYDICSELFEYSKMFKSSFEKYAKTQAKLFTNDIMKALHKKDIKSKIQKICQISSSDDEVLARVKQERIELKEKLDKLEEFISSDKHLSLSKYQQSLLLQQRETMKDYVKILSLRISNWFCEE